MPGTFVITTRPEMKRQAPDGLTAPARPAVPLVNGMEARGERLHDLRALLTLLKRVANRLTPEGRRGRIRQLLPDGPASREPAEQERGSLRPDSAPALLA